MFRYRSSTEMWQERQPPKALDLVFVRASRFYLHQDLLESAMISGFAPTHKQVRLGVAIQISTLLWIRPLP